MFIGTKLSLLTCLVHVLATVPITLANHLDQSQTTLAGNANHRIQIKRTDVQSDRPHTHPEPCCLPYRFQAVTASLLSFGHESKVGNRLFRNWDRKIQIQESVQFNDQGVVRSLSTTYMDFQTSMKTTLSSVYFGVGLGMADEITNYKYIQDMTDERMVQYMFTPGGRCNKMSLGFGMLEPCMPEDARYLGMSYIGAYAEKTTLDTWTFVRTTLNRDINITFAVTSDRCMPVMERITGTIDGGEVETQVRFSNVTESVADSVFDLPLKCLQDQPM